MPKRSPIQVEPNWVKTWSPEEMEQQLRGFKFKGPGLYLSNTDTTLVTRIEDGLPFPPSAVYKNDKRFRVHVYNCPLSDTIFSVTSPTKVDERK